MLAYAKALGKCSPNIALPIYKEKHYDHTEKSTEE